MRISSIYKIYAFQEFRKINHREWTNWTLSIMEYYCDFVTDFDWNYAGTNGESEIDIPKNSK